MKKIGGFQFVVGFVLGAVMFGGSVAFAAGIMAQPKTAAIVIDGKEADIEGYIIEGRHYFQLRDLDAALKAGGKDFSVVWDGQGNRVIIDTSRGYDPNEQFNPQTSPAPAQTTGGYGTVYSPLIKGDVVKTEPVANAKGSVGGDYTITQGAEDKPWKTADGTIWPNVALPAWQSEWDSYPRVSFPNQPPVHFTGDVILQGQKVGTEDVLLVFNPYEVERMIRTIYKYAKQNPLLWKDHDPYTNIPNFTINIEYAGDMGPHTFYPWRDWEIEQFIKSTGGGTTIRIYAYDSYNNGKFLDTEYFMK